MMIMMIDDVFEFDSFDTVVVENRTQKIRTPLYFDACTIIIFFDDDKNTVTDLTEAYYHYKLQHVVKAY